MTNPATPTNQQQQPYLPTSRAFPAQNPVQLEPELVKSYLDIAQAVNVRTIGIFETIQIVTGERWFSVDPLNALKKRQTFRKVIPFGALAAGSVNMIAHGITGITSCTKITGTCVTTFPDFRPLPFSGINDAFSIVLRATSTDIVIAVGPSSPNLLSGIVTLEYFLN